MLLSLLAGCPGVLVLGPGDDPLFEPVACEDTVSPSLSAELAWSHGLTTYGDWLGLHAFSPDGEQLVTAADVYTPEVLTFDTLTGAVTVTSGEIWPWSRDEDWTVEARSHDWDGGQVVDLATGRTLVEDDALGDVWSGGHGLVSGDGRTVAAVGCDDGTTRVLAWDLRSGRRIAETEVQTGCSHLPPNPHQVALSHDGALLYAGLADTGEVYRFALGSGGVDVLQAHTPVEDLPWGHSGAVHTVRLVDSDQLLLTAGPDGWLRQWHADTLEPTAADRAAGSTTVNEDLYANPATTTPVALSPDGTLLAILDTEGELVLQRACDGTALVALPTPEHPAPAQWSIDPGAVAVAWHPSGQGLGVRYEDIVALWTLSE